jgi:hypothetical protein
VQVLLTDAPSMASSVFCARITSLAWLSTLELWGRPIYTFDQYTAAPDTEDRNGRVFNNKAERVKQELWVSAKYIAFIANS